MLANVDLLTCIIILQTKYSHLIINLRKNATARTDVYSEKTGGIALVVKTISVWIGNIRVIVLHVV